jgi:hypothetical protein
LPARYGDDPIYDVLTVSSVGRIASAKLASMPIVLRVTAFLPGPAGR